MTKRANIVVVGGGTGLSVLLRGLKKHPVNITAIVTVADDGGSSGILRNELQIPPPGDIRNVLVALSETEPIMEKLFQHRFQYGQGLSGHSLGNLLLAGMTAITGDFVSGIKEISKVLNVKGKVLPAANHSIVLNAIMSDGTVVEGESQIPKMNKKIERVFLKPYNIEPLEESLQAIREADQIIIGPGSLYTSILPNLLVPKLGQEICRAKAKKIYICNVMTQKGETDYFTASDHIQVILNHMIEPCIDYVVVNSEPIPNEIIKRYEAEGAEPVQFDPNRLNNFGFELISDKIIKYENHIIRHDEKIISERVLSLLPSHFEK